MSTLFIYLFSNTINWDNNFYLKLAPEERKRRSTILQNLYKNLVPSQAESESRKNLFERLKKLIGANFESSILFQYGSAANNLCLKNADMVSLFFFFFFLKKKNFNQ